MSLHNDIAFDPITQKNVELWLEGQYDEETKSQIRTLLQHDPKQAIDAFFTHLTFGTGGMRGIMGVGTNRMNVYTVRAATQGLANYIRTQPTGGKEQAVFIGYDSRNQSRTFAEESAKVLAGNGIRVYLCRDIRPTPLVSFGCRLKNCISAIMVTASHNPPAYNGYKVYWSDGGQLVPPHDQGVIAEVVKITDPSIVKIVSSLQNPLIEEVESEIDQAYIQAITPLQNYAETNRKHGNSLKVVYTSLHGTGITLVPRALTAWGFNNVSFVDTQVIPDGSFPTVKSPNPEEHAALKMGMDKMLATQSDLLIATDPDADRVGAAFMHQNQAIVLNGNQIAVLCLEHVCEALTTQKRMPDNAAFIKTIVTTELFKTICHHYNKPCFEVLTGFKYIAEKIHEWEQSPDGYQYVFGGEESYGYLLGTYTRDKDAVVSSALLCEVALQAKLQGKSLLDKLYDLYHKYGIYQEGLLSLNFGETKEGKEQMTTSMRRLRDTGLQSILHIPVVAIEDYQVLTKYDLKTGHTETLNLPPSNVLAYWLEDGSKVMIRPSGTEPKVKIYCGVVNKKFSSIQEGIEAAVKHCEDLLRSIKQLITS
jgi:phosphomannomutase